MINETLYNYKGFQIIGTYYEKEGAEIFYSGYYRPNSFHRNYNIKRDGRYIINPFIIFERLKDAKEEIDRILINRE